MTVKKVSVRAVALILALMLSCTALPLGAFAAPTGMALFLEDELTIPAGSFGAVICAFSDPTVTSSDVAVTSSNSAVAKVLTYGVTAKSSGSTTVGVCAIVVKNIGTIGTTILTVSSKSGSFTSATLSVTVVDSAQRFLVTSKQVEGVGPKVFVKPGKSLALKPYAVGKDTSKTDSGVVLFGEIYSLSAKKVTWKTSNKKIATVSASGKVSIKKAAKAGKKVTITAKLKGTSKKVKYTFVVAKKTGTIKKLTLSGSKTKEGYAGQMFPIGVGGKFVGTPSHVITWKSSKPGVATVNSEGVVTGKVAGTTKITAKCAKKSVTYTVKIHATQGLVQEAFSLFQLP